MKRITVKSNRGLETQKLLELNGFRVVSWSVVSGFKIVIVYK